MKTILCTLIFQTVLAASAVRAQPMEGNRYVHAELITDAQEFTQPFRVGIRFVIESGWYLYWKNPGDAGLPIEVVWDLPSGWTASVIEYPTPQKFLSEDIVAYGYKDEVILFATITPGPEGTTDLIKANLDWLVCKESCVRGTGEVSLVPGPQSARRQKEIRDNLQRFQLRLPIAQEESGLVFGRPRVKKVEDGITISVELRGSRAGTVKDFFPEVVKNLYIDFASINVSNGTLSLKVSSQSRLRDALLKGLLVTGEESYACVIPIEPS